MIVISMTSCPAKVRGDLSKWLMEINTGVYVGQVNAKVREALWKRICENISDGQATMVYSTNNEQHMEFRVHNTDWSPVDYDGLTLMKHPKNGGSVKKNSMQIGYSNASKLLMGKRSSGRKKKLLNNSDYVILDLETTGLQWEKDQIIELGALKVERGGIVGEYQALVQIDGRLPENIVTLTGITDEMLQQQGVKFREAFNGMMDFILEMDVLIYNAAFDCTFLENACKKNDIIMMENHIVDALSIIKRGVKGVSNYKLETVAKHLGIAAMDVHRSLGDCRTLYVICKLNEK